jgi:hypothetical protein
MPRVAEPYSYWPVVAHVGLDNAPLTITYRAPTLEDIQNARAVNFVPEGFLWGDDVIDCRKYAEWIVVKVEVPEHEEIDYLVRYQRDRLLSGLYPTYTYQPDSLREGTS